jgi:dihydroxyacid dehydratase/phosphogluconate dehydratase
VKDGDIIRVDAKTRVMEVLNLSDQEWADRKAK